MSMARVQPSLLALAACALLGPSALPGADVLHFEAEWRLMRAGEARLTLQTAITGEQRDLQAVLHLATVGLVRTLYKVDNRYSALFDERFCASSTLLLAQESKRRRETRVTFNRPPGKASLLERDLAKNAVIDARDIDVPPCVHDVLAGLARLRGLAPAPGATIELPISDGKKSISARVTALRRETVKTPAGIHQAIRYEAFLFNNVLYRRKGRLFVWLTDDERRLPVQIRIQLPFYLGTITLKLEKQERT
jgi:hypothetical protein